MKIRRQSSSPRTRRFVRAGPPSALDPLHSFAWRDRRSNVRGSTCRRQTVGARQRSRQRESVGARRVDHPNPGPLFIPDAYRRRRLGGRAEDLTPLRSRTRRPIHPQYCPTARLLDTAGLVNGQQRGCYPAGRNMGRRWPEDEPSGRIDQFFMAAGEVSRPRNRLTTTVARETPTESPTQSADPEEGSWGRSLPMTIISSLARDIRSRPAENRRLRLIRGA